MRFRPLVVAFVLSVGFVFTDAARAEPERPSSAGADAPAAPKPDPLAEAAALVEVAPNTPANLQRAIALYDTALKEPAVPRPARLAALIDISRARLRLGDLATIDREKLAHYEKGVASARAAIALDGQVGEAHFWLASNQASIGRTRGVMSSLFMVPELRKSLGRVLELEPHHGYAKVVLARIDHAVPGIAGGSDERAVQLCRDVLARDAAFTPAMVVLAEIFRDQGKKDEARRWAQRVLDAKGSSVPNDWRKFDQNDARKVLKTLDD